MVEQILDLHLECDRTATIVLVETTAIVTAIVVTAIASAPLTAKISTALSRIKSAATGEATAWKVTATALGLGEVGHTAWSAITSPVVRVRAVTTFELHRLLEAQGYVELAWPFAGIAADHLSGERVAIAAAKETAECDVGRTIVNREIGVVVPARGDVIRTA
jgi:hypothetical protein